MDRASRLDAAVVAASDPLHVMQRIVDEAVTLLDGATGSTVELLDEGELVYVCGAGSLAAHVGTRLDAGSSLSGRAARDGVSLRCDDSESDPRVDREACRRVGSASMICVPLRHGGAEPIAVLKVVSSRAHAFGDGDVETLQGLADFITAAISASTQLADATATLFRDGPDLHPHARDSVSTFVANVIRPGVLEDVDATARIREALELDRMTMVLQPIFDLGELDIVGVEALARFPGQQFRSPELWFKEAKAVGLGTALQLEALRRGIAAASGLCEALFVALNLDVECLADPQLPGVLATAGGRPLLLELTENVEVADYPALVGRLLEIRRPGVRLAIDDAGAGYSSLSRVIKLAPDVIKLDRELIRSIDVDPVRRSLVTAVVTFGTETGAAVLAEGMETEGELATVRSLGVRYGQGFVLAPPTAPGARQTEWARGARS